MHEVDVLQCVVHPKKLRVNNKINLDESYDTDINS